MRFREKFPGAVCALFFLVLGLPWLEASELRAYEGCRLVSWEWNDGDSFRVRLPDGEEVVVRLYGVDCVETTVATRADLARLRDQRRYFGIAEAGGTEQESMRIALEYGKLAAAEVSSVLAEPFTVYTAFADARGRGSGGRIYGFCDYGGGAGFGGASGIGGSCEGGWYLQEDAGWGIAFGVSGEDAGS